MIQARHLRILQLSVAIVGAAWLASGCSGTSGRHVDVTAGEYYSQDEYAELSNGEKEAYCSALEGELNRLQGAVETNRGDLKATREQIESLRNQIAPIERNLLRIESDIRALTGQIAEYEALPRRWSIKSGECLWIIAGYEQVYDDPVKWPRIYRANTDKIMDPEWIYPDTVLVIPRDWPRQHRVALDESLSLIAGYWEVYGDPTEWPKLYEANRVGIVDPNLIKPEQVLKIPRQE